MLIEIFDVDHGFCALATGDDGTRVLFDCGHSDRTGLRPSALLASRAVGVLDALVVSHADEDHISDLPHLGERVLIRSVITNSSLGPADLRRVKEESTEVGPGAATLLSWMNPFFAAARGGDPFPVLPGAEVSLWRNPYPSFTDLNNLSLVTFLHYGGLHVVFPGDLEVAGWLALLGNPGFQAELARVNVFVASHHGRENGFCDEIFKYCKPAVIIVSDGPLRHASQETTARYGNKAGGVVIDGRLRQVLTTRRDGSIRLYQASPAASHAWVALPHAILPTHAVYPSQTRPSIGTATRTG